MKTQRVLKKNKYTHLYIKLEVTRLGEPLSHSGANVIHPALDGHGINTLKPASASATSRTSLTAVQLPRREHNHPEPHPTLTPPPLHVPLAPPHERRAPERERAADAHRQQLEADDAEVGPGPAAVRARVLAPQRGERPRAVRGAEDAVAPPEEVHAGREERARGRGVCRGVHAEAVPEEGALVEDVDEGVEEVPDEEHARFGAAVAW